VSDFAGLSADEVYEAEGPVGGELKSFRLVSEWRREIDVKSARRAEQIARSRPISRRSPAKPARGRPASAISRLPSGARPARAAMSVGRRRVVPAFVQRHGGEGTAFLVDLEDEKVVRQRDFQFRAARRGADPGFHHREHSGHREGGFPDQRSEPFPSDPASVFFVSSVVNFLLAARHELDAEEHGVFRLAARAGVLPAGLRRA